MAFPFSETLPFWEVPFTSPSFLIFSIILLNKVCFHFAIPTGVPVFNFHFGETRTQPLSQVGLCSLCVFGTLGAWVKHSH